MSTVMTRPEIDAAKAEAFAGRFVTALNNGALCLMASIGHPIGTLLYTISCMHCMTVSLAQGGEGLGAMWGEEKVREYLRRAGFRPIAVHQLAHDIQNNWYVVRKRLQCGRGGASSLSTTWRFPGGG